MCSWGSLGCHMCPMVMCEVWKCLEQFVSFGSWLVMDKGGQRNSKKLYFAPTLSILQMLILFQKPKVASHYIGRRWTEWVASFNDKWRWVSETYLIYFMFLVQCTLSTCPAPRVCTCLEHHQAPSITSCLNRNGVVFTSVRTLVCQITSSKIPGACDGYRRSKKLFAYPYSIFVNFDSIPEAEDYLRATKLVEHEHSE